MNIGILDNTAPRRNSLAENFTASNRNILALYDESPAWNSLPDSFDILLIHYRDSRAKAVDKLIKDSKTIIYYGGNGEPDPDWNQCTKGSNTYRIWDKLQDSSDVNRVITKAIATNIIAFHSSNLDCNMIPIILRERTPFPLLTSIMIFCSGYLAMNTNISINTNELLNAQYWKHAHLTLESFCKKDNVSNQNTTTPTSKTSLLQNHINKEWNASPPSQTLQILISNLTNDKIPNPSTISQCSVEISNYLDIHSQ